MKLIATSGIALALLAIGSIHQAQLTKPTAQKTAEATAPVESDVSLRMVVAGLTKDNAPALKTALTALTAQAYVCEPCKVEQLVAGKCSKCSGALQAAMKPLLSAVAPTPDQASITLSLNPRRITRLSEIETTLKMSAVTVDSAKLALPGRMTLLVKGGTADKLPMVEKALKEAKLFEEVSASFDAATSEMRFVVRSGATAPTRGKVASLVEAQQLQLVDVHFGPARIQG